MSLHPCHGEQGECQGSRAASTRYYLATYQRANNRLKPSKAGGTDCPRLDIVAYGLNNSWLFGKNTALGVHFWGDLDWSGMRILKALKETFPTIDAWRLGYEPMLIALESGNGHDPTSAGKVGQLKVDFVGCLYADSRLIPCLQSFAQFIDQELIQF